MSCPECNSTCEPDEVECDHCAGGGEINFEVCTDCKGHGIILDRHQCVECGVIYNE